MPEPLVLVPQFFGSLVFERDTSRYLPFDRDATAFLTACVERPFHALLAEAGPQASALETFVDAFYRRGFFTLDGRFAGDVREVSDLPATHLLGPLAVHLELVAACNLKCTHCFAGELPRAGKPLALEELTSLFAELNRLGSFRLGLTGGEPLLRKDLLDVLDAALDAELHPCLTTNALLLTEDMARQLGRREGMWLNVSLEGATAESNDPVRGEGTFERVLEKLELLGRHAPFTLAFTINRNNAEEVEACARLAERVGAQNAVFRPLYPAGVATQHLELMPTFGQYTEALVRLEGLESKRPDVSSCGLDPFSPQSRDASRATVHGNPGCGAGNLVCSVSVEGKVNPCSFLGSGFETGDLREASFESIWRGGHRMRELRALSGGPGRFAGGCRARSLVFGGDVDAPDPWHREWEAAQTGESVPRPFHPLDNLHVRRLPVAEVRRGP